MAVKSVIDIEINDSDFQRYAASFAKYQEELKAAPDVWTEVAASSAAAAAAAAEMGVAIGAAFIELHKANDESSDLTRNTRQQAGLWSSMATNAGKFTSRVVEATRSLLRWGELSGLIGGILGAGGLFGIDRLAISAGSQRRNAFGLGVTPGEANAFEVNYGRVVDPQAMLSGVNQALHDVTKRVGLYGAGMTEDDLRGKDTAQVSSELLQHLKKIADETPEAMMQNVLTARHLDQFINLQDFERLKNTPAGEIQQYQRDFQTDTKNLELSREQAKAWQDLQVQLHRAGAELENSLIRGLTSLAGPIGNLSAAFSKLVEDVLSSKVLREWVDDLANGIKWLGDYIGRPEFRQDVTDFMEGVGKFAHGVMDFVKSVADVVESLGGFANRIRDFFKDPVGEAGKALGNSPLGGPDPDNDPRVPGSPAFNQQRFGTPEGRSLFGGANGGTWEQNAGDRAASQNWMRRQWDSLKNFWHGGDWSAQKSSYEEQPRGVRNNNPLNLQYASGQQGVIGSDGRFGQYATPEAGIAASEQQLLRYQDRYNLNTIAGIVSKWAPPGENDTTSYIAQVSKDTGIKPDQQVDLHDRATASAIIQAMIRRETGRSLDPNVVQRGVDQGLGNTQQAGPKFVPNQGRPASVAINVHNQTGGNSYISASQLAVG